MVPRPFPFPLRIGTDICSVHRIQKVLTGPKGPSFIKRVFAPGEHRPPRVYEALKIAQGREGIEADASARDKDVTWKAATWVAGRWAAKEAVIKAHKRRMYMHDIRIVYEEKTDQANNPPMALVRQDDDAEYGEAVAQLSISHDGDYAMATCLAYDGVAKGSDGEQGQNFEKDTGKGYFEDLEMEDNMRSKRRAQ